MADLAVGLTAFNALLNAAKALKDMKEDSVRLQASIDLQRDIFATQQDYAALLKTVEKLEAKIMEFENWETEKARYEPRQFEPGVTVYALKAGEQGAEMGQHFCPACYDNRKARILQGTDRTDGRRKLRVCLACKAELAYGPQGPLPQVRTGGGSWMSR